MAQNFLPMSAYFPSGGGPISSDLWRDLLGAGFTAVRGPNNGEKATALTIVPPGKPAEQISPPGTAPRQPYDTGSLITITAGLAAQVH